VSNFAIVPTPNFFTASEKQKIIRFLWIYNVGSRVRVAYGMEIISGHQVAPTGQLVMARMWLRDVFRHIIHMNIRGNNPKIARYRPWIICPGYTVL